MVLQRSRRAYLLKPGEGTSVWSLGGRFTIKAAGSDTGDRFSLTEQLATRATEPPLHIHRNEDEAWYVLDGHMTFYVGDQELAAPSGSFVFAPRDIPHTFTVDIEPTRVLVFATPAGFERFALELGQAAVSDEPPPGLAMPSPEVLGTASRWLAFRAVRGNDDE